MKHGKHIQVSESFLLCALLTMTGGFLDVYTYITRGHEGRKKQEKRLEENNNLPPVQQIVFLEFGPYPFREQDAQGKRDDGRIP